VVVVVGSGSLLPVRVGSSEKCSSKRPRASI